MADVLLEGTEESSAGGKLQNAAITICDLPPSTHTTDIKTDNQQLQEIHLSLSSPRCHL